VREEKKERETVGEKKKEKKAVRDKTLIISRRVKYPKNLSNKMNSLQTRGVKL
jgi:hypothetical protein